MSDKIKNLKENLEKFDKKDFNVFFFVVDTEGQANGSLAYIYETAYTLKENGYNVKILHAEKEFVGVGEWLGEKYASLPHELIDKNTNLTVSPSDFLFIQEVHSSALAATKQLPCKRVVILQNFSYLEETCPMGVSFDDLKIRDCIVPTEALKEKMHKFFPEINTEVVHRSIPSFFKERGNGDLIINVIAENHTDVNAIIKPFYWKYPQYKWVAFRPIPNNLSREKFAETLGSSFATIWCDTKTDCGQNALEAMASGNIVIGKVPEDYSDFIFDGEGSIRDNGLWFFNSSEACDIIANVIRAFLTDTLPEVFKQEAEKTVEVYSVERREKETLSVYSEIFNRRKAEIEKLIEYYKTKKEEN